MAKTAVPASYESLPRYIGKFVKVFDVENGADGYAGEYVDVTKITGMLIQDETADDDGEVFEATVALLFEDGASVTMLDSVQVIADHPCFHPMLTLSPGA